MIDSPDSSDDSLNLKKLRWHDELSLDPSGAARWIVIPTHLPQSPKNINSVVPVMTRPKKIYSRLMMMTSNYWRKIFKLAPLMAFLRSTSLIVCNPSP
ncbi:hypothetical protein V6N12_009944 [Hibiscus sabdariffa]|uniref:Uncharacterized protein n=1 Tax=Hibiscus sabdariffa TaxID=183260 RepID=A0ABR2EC82_9ROSI